MVMDYEYREPAYPRLLYQTKVECLGMPCCKLTA
jgi:hypothetical protein